jgi:paraquat-inducible protein B
MSRQANAKLVGAFVVGAIGLLSAAVVVLSNGAFWRDRPSYILYFEGAATGLQVGSPVVFRGVKIGSVESIGLSVDQHNLNFLVPVVIRTDEYVLKNLQGEAVALADIAANSELVKRGLRARLKTWSFLTGQLYIDLDFYPDKPLRLYNKEKRLREIPTLPTEVEEFTNKLDKLNVEKLLDDVATISASVRNLVSAPAAGRALENLDTTLEHLSSLTAGLDARTANLSKDMRELIGETSNTLRETRSALQESAETLRAARATLTRIDESAANVAALTRPDAGPLLALTRASDELAATARTLREATGDDSSTRYRLDEMLEETAAAARALRLLAEALETNPESVLKGRAHDEATE